MAALACPLLVCLGSDSRAATRQGTCRRLLELRQRQLHSLHILCNPVVAPLNLVNAGNTENNVVVMRRSNMEPECGIWTVIP